MKLDRLPGGFRRIVLEGIVFALVAGSVLAFREQRGATHFGTGGS